MSLPFCPGTQVQEHEGCCAPLPLLQVSEFHKKRLFCVLDVFCKEIGIPLCEEQGWELFTCISSAVASLLFRYTSLFGVREIRFGGISCGVHRLASRFFQRGLTFRWRRSSLSRGIKTLSCKCDFFGGFPSWPWTQRLHICSKKGRSSFRPVVAGRHVLCPCTGNIALLSVRATERS